MLVALRTHESNTMLWLLFNFFFLRKTKTNKQKNPSKYILGLSCFYFRDFFFSLNHSLKSLTGLETWVMVHFLFAVSRALQTALAHWRRSWEPDKSLPGDWTAHVILPSGDATLSLFPIRLTLVSGTYLLSSYNFVFFSLFSWEWIQICYVQSLNMISLLGTKFILEVL